MVNNVTSLTGNGLKDWLIQRVTAVYFAGYSVFLLVFFLMHPGLNFGQWHALFANQAFKLATAIALIAMTLHAWIGIWTVTTDYMKCTIIRLSVQMLVVLWLLSQFIWGMMIVWGQ
ncbi:succinate dehydrogenase, hydrophobic membrane anchor protein [Legionella waltersii]|uniref:Succinate dehydrogenase hydrophobic membrane anchor subunit n=1 Tax=Legionella waltersii TaxID=66969 RepID=A0A0W1A2Y4_9GAMM|nr:succinate dehydrogenase, hydrophobic membrane anchor protein [Legionella waltersii]KTD75670.1 succinate dehydrogenase, hydrophobic membrane anchor protein [Legionella waltersii]SNU99264.1 succinate dehydrogenase, hydrophobic membrane anchor protein [Legionella waltersii]